MSGEWSMTISSTTGKRRGTGGGVGPLRLQLTAGARPFLLTRRTSTQAWGWVFPDPQEDSADPLLKDLGIQAVQRQTPCYVCVPVDRLV